MSLDSDYLGKMFPDISITQPLNNTVVITTFQQFSDYRDRQHYISALIQEILMNNLFISSDIYVDTPRIPSETCLFRRARKHNGRVESSTNLPMINCTSGLLTEYYNEKSHQEIRLFFRKEYDDYRCLGVSWDEFGYLRGNLSNPTGKLLSTWHPIIATTRRELLDSCSVDTRNWASNGYTFPNLDGWHLKNVADGFCPDGFHFVQSAIYSENVADCNGERADYILILNDAPRYIEQQRAFWNSVDLVMN